MPNNRWIAFFVLAAFVTIASVKYLSENSRRMISSISPAAFGGCKNQVSAAVKYEDFNVARDYMRYTCSERRRIGGSEQLLANFKDKDPLWRVEGAWFLCFDKGLAPLRDACTVISLGVNTDESFDVAMNTDFGCRVESFDPFIEAERFTRLRNADTSLANAVTLKVNDKWHFHRIGVTEHSQMIDAGKIGELTTLGRAIERVGLANKTIDVIKMDIEKHEWFVLADVDMDYMCKHVKQFVMETHPEYVWPDVPIKLTTRERSVELMRRLEKCFRLFHRDTRFFIENGFEKTEFQEPRTFNINTGVFLSETKLIEFMVTFGELYFINKNFIA